MPKTAKPAAKKINLRPLMGYLIVEPVEPETKTASGIVLPETAQERPTQARVVAVGEDIVFDNGKVIKSPVKIGDVVVYKKWGGDEIKINGVEYKIVKFEDLMAVMEE